MKLPVIKISLLVVIATATMWQCIGAWQDSQTTDEAVHLVSGLSYWQTGSFELNPEHPALFKLVASWPLVLLPHAQIQTDTEIWRSRNQWTIGAQYVHYSAVQQRYGSHFLMLVGRLPMILVWLLLILTVARWSWKHWGPLASLTATTLLAYDPNFLGHGHLVTNDVPLAFAYLGTFLLLRRAIITPRWRNIFFLAVVFALAQLTKYSAVVLWLFVPFVMMVALSYRLPAWKWRWVWRSLLVCAVMSFATTWAVYGFQIDRISKDPHIAELWQTRQYLVDHDQVKTVPPVIQTVVHLADPSTLTGHLLDRFQQFSIPSYWYWRGFFSAQYHNLVGHVAYLMGQVSELGWWYYFPVALFVKTPIPLLFAVMLFCVLSISTTIYRLRKRTRPLIPIDFWFLGFPPIAFLAISMASHINIGIRHVFPTYVFWPLAAGALIVFIQSFHQRLTIFIASILVVSSIALSAIAWPNTIGYFNGLVGGTKQGYRYVLDSNIDWNQDFWRLRKFLDRQKFSEVHIALFGSIPNDVYFPEMRNVPTDQQIQAGERPTGIIVISIGQLYHFDGPFFWLRTRTPTWRVGSSILVYDFR